METDELIIWLETNTDNCYQRQLIIDILNEDHAIFENKKNNRIAVVEMSLERWRLIQDKYPESKIDKK
ncbi:MAG: hypothetical protein WC390_07205 [Sulfurimonas sp.]|jgi:hypothetical protein